jgi:vacuolar-type H+-ATPase subunit E/Vma4
MSLEKIIDKILNDSRAKADVIIEEARAEADRILAKGREKARSEKDNKIKESLEKLQNEKQRKIALAKLESRKKILKARCDLIDVVFSKAIEQLKSLKGENLRLFIQKLLGDFRPTQLCDVIVHAPESDKYTLLLSSLWGAAFTKFCRMKPSDTPLGGGVIIKSERMEYDCTFARLVNEERQNLEQDLVKILFPENT